MRSEDKITEQDRPHYQTQQELLYKTLDQIDRWYVAFREKAERYRARCKFYYEESSKVSIWDLYTYRDNRDGYSHSEFRPLDPINGLVDKNRNANTSFAGRITSCFNRTYNVPAPECKIDEGALQMGSRPVYGTYVDMAIKHLDGKSFRGTAVEEPLAEVARVVKSSC